MAGVRFPLNFHIKKAQGDCSFSLRRFMFSCAFVILLLPVRKPLLQVVDHDLFLHFAFSSAAFKEHLQLQQGMTSQASIAYFRLQEALEFGSVRLLGIKGKKDSFPLSQ